MAPTHLWHDQDVGKQDGCVQIVSADGLHRHLRNIVRVLNVNVCRTREIERLRFEIYKQCQYG